MLLLTKFMILGQHSVVTPVNTRYAMHKEGNKGEGNLHIDTFLYTAFPPFGAPLKRIIQHTLVVADFFSALTFW